MNTEVEYEVFLDDVAKELAEQGIGINEFNIVEYVGMEEE